MNIINLTISSILQVIILSLIPLIWWLCTDRKNSNFINWLGFKKTKITDKRKFILAFLVTIPILLMPAYLIIPIFVSGTEMATSQFLGQGISALIPALIYSFVQTGLSEEIFFRGFLNKRLINKLGFNLGNFIQGLLFGLLHGCMFISICGLFGAVVITLITGFVGYLMGFINEKLSNGSIIPSWLLHGCSNLIASLIAMFSLL